MSDGKSTFVYVTYIRATPEAVWDALTTADFMRKYWFGMAIETDWRVGSPWALTFPDGRLADAGEVLEFEPPKRLLLKWRHELRPEWRAEGHGECLIEIEPQDGATRLSITHSMKLTDSNLIQGVSGGWPRIVSNLKSLLETGEAWLTHQTRYQPISDSSAA